MRTLAKQFLPAARPPPALPRHSCQGARRIHRNSISNGLEHPQIAKPVAVSKTPRKINPVTRGELRNRAHFRAAAHVLACDPPTPYARRTRGNFQFGRVHFDLRRNQRAKSPRRHTSQRRQSPGHDKQTMPLRAVPHNPSAAPRQKRARRIPARKFQTKRFLPLTLYLFA